MSRHSVDCECHACCVYWSEYVCSMPESDDSAFVSESSAEGDSDIFYSVSSGALSGGGGTTTTGSERSERLIYNKDT